MHRCVIFSLFLKNTILLLSNAVIYVTPDPVNLAQRYIHLAVRSVKTPWNKNNSADRLNKLSVVFVILFFPLIGQCSNLPFFPIGSSCDWCRQTRKRRWLAVCQVNIQQRMLAVSMSDKTEGQQLPNNWSKDETTCFAENVEVFYHHRLASFHRTRTKKLQGAACCH